jgi:hypothetical protein
MEHPIPHTISSKTDKANAQKSVLARENFIPPVLASHHPSELVAFSITTDSIVATVRFTPNADHRAVQIFWGDDTVDLIDVQRPQLNLGSDVPQGSYKKQHVYRRNPANNLYPSRVYIILVVYNHVGKKLFIGQAVDIVPRYRCVIYPVQVKATHHDTSLEEVSEFDISIHIRQGEKSVLRNQWRWEPKTFSIDGFSTTVGIVAEKYLEGSAFATEMTWADDPLQIYTAYVDDDGMLGGLLDFLADVRDIFLIEFDDTVYATQGSSIPWGIHPVRNQGPFEEIRHYGSEFVYLDFYIRGAMEVIIPIDRGPVSALFGP